MAGESNMTVITVEQLEKKYTIGHQRQERYVALRDVIAHTARGVWQRMRHPLSPNREQINLEEIWALQDVNFEVKQGERIGIIGRNGAGKTTLLKILSRITPPTIGRVHIKGRVASLLEVGTGFHPELTGRENIYLNGAILGMTRQEIKKKFDEIVAFAEVEKFLDTPVKRYSSGMYVRLAFAVAAHLEPEILLVDEVLAVGDAQFQKKCLGKMEDVTKEGRTVLFVSHNMAAITQLCSQCILLEQGRITCQGKTETVVGNYMNLGGGEKGSVNLENNQYRKGNRQVVFIWAKTCKHDGEVVQDFSIGDDLYIHFAIYATHLIKDIKLAVQLKTSDGINLCNMIDTDSKFQVEQVEGLQAYSICLRDIRLYPDTYYLSFWAGSTNSIEVYDHVEDCLMCHILDGGKLTMRPLPRPAGIFFFTPDWRRLEA
jgi:lipopolysaccharide transport system ATP-binding protein